MHGLKFFFHFGYMYLIIHIQTAEVYTFWKVKIQLKQITKQIKNNLSTQS